MFERGGVPELAIEVKRSSAPKIDKGFAIACDELGLKNRFVVYPGSEQFGLPHGATAISLKEMVSRLAGKS